MSGELRAAAERVLSPLEKDCWLDFADNVKGWFAAAVRGLAEAYLAEHPADSELPVTEEWLRSVGLGNRSHIYMPLSMHGYAHSVSMTYDRDHQWMMCTTRGSGSRMPIAAVKTRGDVRRLCAALGVELQESNNAE